jgi:hypothetical protein
MLFVFCLSGGVASLNRPANGLYASGIGIVIRSLTASARPDEQITETTEAIEATEALKSTGNSRLNKSGQS